MPRIRHDAAGIVDPWSSLDLQPSTKPLRLRSRSTGTVGSRHSCNHARAGIATSATGVLVGMIILYLLLVEIGKVVFYEHLPVGQPLAAPVPHKRARHRASRWSVPRLVREASTWNRALLIERGLFVNLVRLRPVPRGGSVPNGRSTAIRGRRPSQQAGRRPTATGQRAPSTRR